jgi:coenzyme F420-reducing hydrogenase beta subunit
MPFLLFLYVQIKINSIYFRVEHIAIDNIDDLYKLRKSKYFQSYMGKTYKFVKDYLEDGRRVLFTGTPCQIVGLKKYLGRYYANLILVDLLCANCPSAEIFNKYICEKDHSSNIKQYNFRHKKETNEVWDAKSVLLEMKNGEKIVKDIDNDMYLKVYHTCSLDTDSSSVS